MGQDLLVSSDQLARVLAAADALEELRAAVGDLHVRPAGPDIPGVPVELVWMILQRWGDLADAEKGLSADERAMDVLRQRVPMGDLAREAAAVALAWVETSAKPAVDYAVPS